MNYLKIKFIRSVTYFLGFWKTISHHGFMPGKLQRPALGQSQGSVKSFLGSSTGWWADTTATLLPGKKETARGTREKINTEPQGPTLRRPLYMAMRRCPHLALNLAFMVANFLVGSMLGWAHMRSMKMRKGYMFNKSSFYVDVMNVLSIV